MSRIGRPEHALPPAQVVPLGARGTTTVWDSMSWGDSPAHASTPLVLLHGWNIDAPTNFESAFAWLARDRRVVMFDQHGHGAGPRRAKPFSIKDSAEDACAVLDALGIDSAILAGYSLGGAVAQTMGRTATNRVEGIVLAATATAFAKRRREHAQFSALGTASRAMQRLPEAPRRQLFDQIARAACRRYPPWILSTVRTADPVTLLQAGSSLGTFDSSRWLGSLHVPCAVILTERDTIVPPHRQALMIEHLSPVEVIRVDADHDLPIRSDPRFADALEVATRSVEGARTRWSEVATTG